MLLFEETNRPGKGNQWFGQEKSAPNVGPIPIAFIDRLMSSPSKCIHMLGWSPKEVLHLLEYLEQEIVQNGGRNGGRYRPCKASTLARLIVLLWSIQSNDVAYRMEGMFGWAKSSINDDKYFLGALLLKILKREVGQLWPTHDEQLLLISCASESLQPHKPFFIVDSTKLANNDSTDLPTRNQHWNNHKGFGCHMILFSDIFGNLIWFEAMRNGNGSDVSQYRSSAPFLQEQGCTFAPDHTGMGDTAYVSASSTDPNSAPLLSKYDLDDPAFNNQADLYALAERFNDDYDTTRSTIERVIRGSKRFGALGHKSAISLRRGISTQQYVFLVIIILLYLMFVFTLSFSFICFCL